MRLFSALFGGSKQQRDSGSQQQLAVGAKFRPLANEPISEKEDPKMCSFNATHQCIVAAEPADGYKDIKLQVK